MSSRRLDSTIATEDEVKDLILELQALLSTEVDRSRTTKVLEEICNHIKKLQKEVDNLSKKICGLLGPPDTSSNVDFAEVLKLVMEL
ncbi:transcription factor ILI5-like [Castanea sativa]|uniref:transcription factor ILI5-like n=1 Tax=Castanea sativa TaxID=21020 RepID=UPI003F64F55B